MNTELDAWGDVFLHLLLQANDFSPVDSCFGLFLRVVVGLTLANFAAESQPNLSEGYGFSCDGLPNKMF